MSRDWEQHWAGLLRAANRGDRKAYRAFLDSVAPVLRGVLRARHGGLDAADREDILQEVLLAVHLKRHTWREEEPVRPWLFAIVRYKVIDTLRARGRRQAVDIEDFAEILAAPDGEDPTVRSDVERMMAELDGRSGEIVRAIGLEGASVAEAGARYAISEGAVRVALHRGLKTLARLRARMVE